MNRKTSSALAITAISAVAFAAAAVVSANAYADDITIDNTRFVSTKSRADVQAELMNRAALGGNEWTRQHNDASQFKSALTSEQAKAEYKASRQMVNALNAEDSGSAYFIKSSAARAQTATMGGSAN